MTPGSPSKSSFLISLDLTPDLKKSCSWVKGDIHLTRGKRLSSMAVRQINHFEAPFDPLQGAFPV